MRLLRADCCGARGSGFGCIPRYRIQQNPGKNNPKVVTFIFKNLAFILGMFHNHVPGDFQGYSVCWNFLR